MVDYLREIVSGNKKRFVDTKYNLDLTYITPRVVAMAYPASGISSFYRNDIETVRDFLNLRHQTNYVVFNLSGRTYDHSYFNNKVLEYKWLDHHPPQLEIIFDIVKKMKAFSIENESNVIVVHCNAGKGRTGTIICCYLLFLGYFSNVTDCLAYYSKRRFEDGDAVTQPGQVRYINYFYTLLSQKILFPLRKQLYKIVIHHPPLREKEGELRPYIDIVDNVDNLIFTNKAPYINQEKIFFNQEIEVKLTESNFHLEIFGDITIRLYNQYLLSDKKMGRISFNSAFIKDNSLTFKVDEIDPDRLKKKSYVSKDCYIKLYFQNLCECKEDNISSLCTECKEKLNQEIDIWKHIRKIIEVSTRVNLLNHSLTKKKIKKLLSSYYLVRLKKMNFLKWNKLVFMYYILI